MAGLARFKDRLAPNVDFDTHFEPVAVRAAFPAMVAAEDETVMLTDRATDASASQGLAHVSADVGNLGGKSTSLNHSRQLPPLTSLREGGE